MQIMKLFQRRPHDETAALPFLPPGDVDGDGDCVLARELEHIHKRRERISGTPQAPASGNAVHDAHVARPLGVAFSGGGIRSATFNLGILQGLAERGLLPHVDYLSTVSGGGYIGSWLHGVIKRGGNQQTNGTPDAATAVLSTAEHPVPGPPQADPISFLRKFSNYLAPRPGLLSLDSWVIGTIWTRNFLLNQLLLLPAIAALIMSGVAAGSVEHFALDVAPTYVRGDNSYLDLLINFATDEIVVFTLLCLFLPGVLIARSVLAGIVKQTFPDSAEKSMEPRDTLVRSNAVVALMFIGTLLLGFVVPGDAVIGNTSLAAGLFLLLVVFQYEGGFPECYRAAHKDSRIHPLVHSMWMSGFATAVACSLIWIVWYRLPWGVIPDAAPWLRIALGPTLVSGSLLAGGTLQTGLMGADYPDAAREWMARIAASVGRFCMMWSGFFAFAVFGPWAFAWVAGRYSATAAAAVSAWAGTVLAGVFAGKSEKTDGDAPQKSRSPLRWLVAAAPPLFVAGYTLIIAGGVHVAIKETDTWYHQPVAEGRLEPVREFAAQYWKVLTGDSTSSGYPVPTGDRATTILLFIGACAVVGGIANWRININEFSMHHFYKNRLVRCYLGASSGESRKPNAYTGFDSTDDINLHDLVPDAGYFGPYAIINATLNLNKGSELAKQERKSDSFIFTPAFCGFSPSKANEVDEDPEKFGKAFDRFGYRETAHYSHPRGPHIGTAMAISGAAANPNSGYHTSAPMAFLLTVFNARLGWWLGNPRHRDASRDPGPRASLWYLLCELVGQTTATTKYLNLSDGGHFENLGLYELVRRRCRYIVIGDGEQDPEMTFEGLGGAIRKCRADFGVEIDLRPDPIRLGANGMSTVHCVVGLVTYPEEETGRAATFSGEPIDLCPGGRARGWILYLKSSVTGDEPADVLQYRSANPAFPQQTTADQFFTESQFESYRRLGLHIARTAFEGVDVDVAKAPDERLLDAFQALARNWYPPPPVTGDDARLTEIYTALVDRLAEGEGLEQLADALLPPRTDPKDRRTGRTERMFILDLIQLMEDVFVTYSLEHEANRANPRIAGWMRVFKRWSDDQKFRDVWNDVKLDYNPLFRRFVGDGIAESLARPTDLPPRP